MSYLGLFLTLVPGLILKRGPLSSEKPLKDRRGLFFDFWANKTRCIALHMPEPEP